MTSFAYRLFVFEVILSIKNDSKSLILLLFDKFHILISFHTLLSKKSFKMSKIIIIDVMSN